MSRHFLANQVTQENSFRWSENGIEMKKHSHDRHLSMVGDITGFVLYLLSKENPTCGSGEGFTSSNFQLICWFLNRTLLNHKSK